MMMNLSALKINDYKLLSDKEIKDLLIKSQKGSQEAKDTLIKHNLRLVLKISHRFQNADYSLDDIFQLGIIGLIKAIDGFDLKRSVKFSTYAVPLIIGEIKMFLRDDNIVKVSRSIKEKAYQIHQIKEDLLKKLNREPTIQELSQALQLAPEEIVRILEAVGTPKSIYQKTYQNDESSITLVDQLADNKDYYQEKLTSLTLNQVLNKLDGRSKRIIKLRYLEEKSQSEIAKLLGLSQAQISRLEKNILKIIRNELLDKHRR